MPFVLSPVLPPILIEKYRHAIHKDANSERRWGRAIFFPSLQLLGNRSSIFPSQQILIYATLEARLQSTQGIVLFASLFQGASDFSFRFQSKRNSNHGKPFGSFP
ncbi:hypothetical protein AVEN_138462-1 [Araneus ventricosus]|uniref:Uncharacterized protein n=1 Tax=Araneus ventricosus TaxID=182803 RepID=A0A4Y2CD73_ARAVE|nr:hypothetical protein AVEN_138462-1 [Araneus ventricosus]